MLVAILEGRGFAVLDRLAEMGRQGIVWKLGKSREEFVWEMLTDQKFPGLAPLVALGLGIKIGKRACALVKFCSVKREGDKLVNWGEVRPPPDFRTEIGGRVVELKNAGKFSLVFYEGSEMVCGNLARKGEEIEKVEARERDGKESAKILRTFSARIFERFSKMPMFYGFGKLRKYRRIEGFMSSMEPEIAGIGKALGMKVVPPGKIFGEEGFKVVHLKPKRERELIPVLARSGEEKVVVVVMGEMFAGVILAGKGVEADTAPKFLMEARGLGTLRVPELRMLLQEYGGE